MHIDEKMFTENVIADIIANIHTIKFTSIDYGAKTYPYIDTDYIVYRFIFRKRVFECDQYINNIYELRIKRNSIFNIFDDWLCITSDNVAKLYALIDDVYDASYYTQQLKNIERRTNNALKNVAKACGFAP